MFALQTKSCFASGECCTRTKRERHSVERAFLAYYSITVMQAMRAAI